MSDPLLNVMKVMLLAGLYLFFVRVLWAVYNELRDPATKTGSQPATRPPAPADKTGARPITELVIVDPAPVAGQRWRLGDTATIGRSDTCDVCFEDTYVSGVHARLFARDGHYFVEDLDSRNGTILNGETVEATIAVRPGDRLRIGATTMEFQ